MSSDWGYGKDNGPSCWSDQYPSAKGEQQSPIDITPTESKAFEPTKKLTWKYVPDNCESIENTGHGWKVHVHGEGSELSGGPLEGIYQLEQFHCHWGDDDNHGSEHTINGQSFAGEVHFVHWNTKYKSFDEASEQNDGLCVVGVLLQVGDDVHDELDRIVRHLGKIEYKEQSAELDQPVDPAAVIPEDGGYWSYHGSLTTPPCSECVDWIVCKRPIQVGRDQLREFRKLRTACSDELCLHDEWDGYLRRNYRPTCPIGARELLECNQ